MDLDLDLGSDLILGLVLQLQFQFPLVDLSENPIVSDFALVFIPPVFVQTFLTYRALSYHSRVYLELCQKNIGACLVEHFCNFFLKLDAFLF